MFGLKKIAGHEKKGSTKMNPFMFVNMIKRINA
jgi:hypothetical protein